MANVDTDPVTSVRQQISLADRYRSEGRLAEAEALCRHVLERHPGLPDAEHLLGVMAHQNGHLRAAIDHLQRAVERAPQIALFHANLGEMYRLSGRPQAAIEAARRALSIDPGMAAAHCNLGVALYEVKDFEGAVAAHRTAIAIQPNYVEAHSNLGNAQYGLRRFEEAVEAYRRALDLNPGFADAWANLGTALHHSGRFAEARRALRMAIALDPGHANAHAGLGILLLMQGDFGEGWDHYEWRLRSTERKGPRFPERPWGGESLAGQHILVYAEQGFGDTLQFCRYIPLLVARGAEVTVRVHQQLVALLRDNLSGLTVLGDRGEPAPYRYDAALLSLPSLVGTRLETIPATVPYLRAPGAAAARWRARLTSRPGLRVGLVWAGNPEHVNDRRRSLGLPAFEPLLAVPGVSFASLQIGPRTADLQARPRSGPTIEDLSRDLTDFADTAAAVEALDLVIAVDTAVAHLVGALGKPVWVVLPWVSDWRWLSGRDSNPWYPTMRLFRQAEGQDMERVVARIATELGKVAQGDMTALTPFAAEGKRHAAHAAAILAVQARRASAPAAEASRQTITAGQALILAEQKRRQGFLADADALGRRALAAEPDHAEAEHTLGLIAYQSGQAREAIDHLRRAIAIDPTVALYHANLGEMCRLAGLLDEAVAEGQRALALDPDNTGAIGNLGIALFDKGLYEEALAHQDRAVALQPASASAHSNRGNALQRLKRFGEAEPAYRRALDLAPGFVDGWNNLGTCLRELKRPAEAEEAYRKALDLAPNSPEILDSLSLAVKDLGRPREAAELLRRALVMEARSDKINMHLGHVLLDLKKVDEAALSADRALALNPDSHDAVNLMGRIATARGDPEGAVVLYRRALALKPDLADAHNNMGNALKELGRLAEAEHAFLDALRLDPGVTGVYVNLADSHRFGPGDPLLAAMEALAATRDGLAPADRYQLDFALAKAYADLKDHDRAFAHLLAGNAGKRARVDYDEAAALALFDRIEAVFTPALIASLSGGGDPSRSPLFVIGMPRSGTTLVEQILASHPLVHGAGELTALNDVVGSLMDQEGRTPFPEGVRRLDAAALRRLGTHYVEHVRQRAPPVPHVTDKMPSNYYFAGLIHLALPNARIIHCVRDPVDTCVSCFSKLFTDDQNHTYDLAELGRYYRRYDRLMAHWRAVLPAGTLHAVRYEDLVRDTAREARSLLAFCGLPWNDRCLSFHTTDRPIRTASATQVRQPIYASAIGRGGAYKKYLTPLIDGLGLSR